MGALDFERAGEIRDKLRELKESAGLRLAFKPRRVMAARQRAEGDTGEHDERAALPRGSGDRGDPRDFGRSDSRVFEALNRGLGGQ